MTERMDDLTHMEPLVATDRCDRCGAQAWVRVSLGDNDLLFCGHHFTAAEAKLAPIATHIHDEREALRAAETPALA